MPTTGAAGRRSRWAAARPGSSASSAIASGLPPVSACTRASQSSVTGDDGQPVARGCAQRPGRARRRPAGRGPRAGRRPRPPRPATSIATGSEPSRRAAKTRALAEGRSSSWTSSSSDRDRRRPRRSGRAGSASPRRWRTGRRRGPSSSASAADEGPRLGQRRSSRADPAPGRSTGEQTGERHLPLGLGAGRAQDAEAVEATLGPAQQRGLADARLAGDGQHAAGTDPRPGDEPIDGLLLVLPSDQHPPSLGVVPG